jgi:hypothetical protein
MSEQNTILATEIDAWQNGSKQTDDILVMGIKM